MAFEITKLTYLLTSIAKIFFTFLMRSRTLHAFHACNSDTHHLLKLWLNRIIITYSQVTTDFIIKPDPFYLSHNRLYR